MIDESFDYIKCPKCNESISFKELHDVSAACNCGSDDNYYFKGFWFDRNAIGSYNDNLLLDFNTMKIYKYPLQKFILQFILQINDENILSLYNKFCETKCKTEKEQLINQLFKEFYNNYILKIKNNLIFE